ncbi:MAG: response regulator transcription factor [Sphingorhabdus sp.]
MRDIFDKQNNGSLIMRIAIADDEADVVSFLKSIIDEMGHTSVTFSDGLAVGQSLVRETYDLLILDWSRPKRDGLETLKWMQDSLTERPPVIMLTARSAKKDISDALNAGADDYITKPEDRGVIMARINAMLRRNATVGAFDTKVTYGKYEFDRIEQTVFFDGQTVSMTAKEFELADLFFRNRDRTLSRNYIMETIWRTTAALATRTLDMHISRVRSKLDLKPENGFRIFTVFGYGYRLETMDPK